MNTRTALSTAQASMARKLTVLLSNDNNTSRLWAASDHDPDAALLLADSIDRKVEALTIGIDLLRHEAKLVIEARKGAKA